MLSFIISRSESVKPERVGWLGLAEDEVIDILNEFEVANDTEIKMKVRPLPIRQVHDGICGYCFETATEEGVSRLRQKLLGRKVQSSGPYDLNIEVELPRRAYKAGEKLPRRAVETIWHEVTHALGWADWDQDFMGHVEHYCFKGWNWVDLVGVMGWGLVEAIIIGLVIFGSGRAGEFYDAQEGLEFFTGVFICIVGLVAQVGWLLAGAYFGKKLYSGYYFKTDSGKFVKMVEKGSPHTSMLEKDSIMKPVASEGGTGPVGWSDIDLEVLKTLGLKLKPAYEFSEGYSYYEDYV